MAKFLFIHKVILIRKNINFTYVLADIPKNRSVFCFLQKIKDLKKKKKKCSYSILGRYCYLSVSQKFQREREPRLIKTASSRFHQTFSFVLSVVLTFML